jgi:hypothetical protein
MIFRLIYVFWVLGFIALALAATSQLLFSSSDLPNRGAVWANRLLLAAIWPVALFSPAGRDRLRSLFKF